MNVQEEIRSLQLLINSAINSDKNEKDKITVLKDIKPSSFTWVLMCAIEMLDELLVQGEQYEKRKT